jgi:hypothetical protein
LPGAVEPVDQPGAGRGVAVGRDALADRLDGLRLGDRQPDRLPRRD